MLLFFGSVARGAGCCAKTSVSGATLARHASRQHCNRRQSLCRVRCAPGLDPIGPKPRKADAVVQRAAPRDHASGYAHRALRARVFLACRGAEYYYTGSQLTRIAGILHALAMPSEPGDLRKLCHHMNRTGPDAPDVPALAGASNGALSSPVAL